MDASRRQGPSLGILPFIAHVSESLPGLEDAASDIANS